MALPNWDRPPLFPALFWRTSIIRTRNTITSDRMEGSREPVDGLGVLLVVVVGKGAVGLLLLNQVVQVAVEGVEAGDGAGGLLLAVQRLLQLHLYHVVLDGKDSTCSASNS